MLPATCTCTCNLQPATCNLQPANYTLRLKFVFLLCTQLNKLKPKWIVGLPGITLIKFFFTLTQWSRQMFSGLIDIIQTYISLHLTRTPCQSSIREIKPQKWLWGKFNFTGYTEIHVIAIQWMVWMHRTYKSFRDKFDLKRKWVQSDKSVVGLYNIYTVLNNSIFSPSWPKLWLSCPLIVILTLDQIDFCRRIKH